MELPVRYFQARDAAELAYRELGEGRPLVLIHGYFSTALVNWVRYGHAAMIAAQGYRVIMPDLRGHGDSAKPHAAAAYPPDVLTDDGFALLDHLGLTEYDLGGYSLGGRTALRMLVRGATPGRAIVAGMGLDGIVHTGDRAGYFRHVLTNLGGFPRGSLEWMTEAFLNTVRGDPAALLHGSFPFDLISSLHRHSLLFLAETTHPCVGVGIFYDLPGILFHGGQTV